MPHICATCRSETSSTESCPECGGSPLLEDRYRLEAMVGRGNSGLTYRATRLEDDRTVCVKELSYGAMDSLEAVELFEREAKVLRQLDHRGIPTYHDDLTVERETGVSMYLVQEFVDGRTLEEEMDERRHDEADILAILEELADILAYLQERRPPVFHRDIKPSNVMRRKTTDLVLVDFGSVKAKTDGAVGGSTIAGTFGYMAPEQHWGRAEPQTDVYGLGALGLTLLTRREPTEFVGSDHQLDFRGEIEASDAMVGLLGELLAHDLEERPADAERARRRIARARSALEDSSTPEAHEPEHRRQGTVSLGRRASQEGPVEYDDADRSGPSSTAAGDEAFDDERESSMGWIAAVFFGAVAAVILGLALANGGLGPPDILGVDVGAHACESENCLSIDESFIEGLALGLTADELRERGFEVPEADASETPGAFETTLEVAGRDARCKLRIAPRTGRLHKYTCTIPTMNRISSHRRATEDVIREVVQAYGAPAVRRLSEDGKDRSVSEGDKFSGYWVWKEGKVELRIDSQFEQDMFEAAMSSARDRGEREALQNLFGDGDTESDGTVRIEHHRPPTGDEDG